MYTIARHCLALLLLLTLSGTAAAQAWPSESTEAITPHNYEAPTFVPQSSDESMQAFVGIRHNETDGTVVGLSLRPPGYPAFLLQVEVVPPGHGPIAEKQDVSAPAPLAPESQNLRSVHKLSLRYRF